ncbi:leucine-rich repeat-containing protein 42 [Thalassophryne amazonica]|uniref:leucine-rich repeat-containing protein 42 n=1 Tax=Thalassophryne amazonica TaxID=390379 RepID=UPI001471383C|nr:leucine-rich repeat-containing protein 42 [Thalassophryne amazonica]
MCDLGNSTIYVREKGHVHRVGDIVLAQSKLEASCRRTNPLVLRKEHFIFTYNSEGSLRYTSKSLFDITLLFVAENIHHVDSLVGFPGQIGARLFSATEEKCVFLNPDVSRKALQLFGEAYGEMVLGSLCLRNRFALLHERIDEIKTFHGLKSLDLFGCRLGDDHEIFQHLTSSPLARSLTQLYIGENKLSDVGLQRLTAPVRMMNKGLDGLQVLDVSYNPLSEKAIRYLTCLPKLEKLDVSCTHLKLDTELKKAIWDLLQLTYSEKPLDTFDHSRCKSKGWAEEVINQWEINGTQMPKQKKIDESRTAALHFFGRQKFVRELLKVTPLVCETKEAASGERLQFIRPAAKDHTEDSYGAFATHHQAKIIKKRQQQSGRCDSFHHSPPTKYLVPSALSPEDMELLNSY